MDNSVDDRPSAASLYVASVLASAFVLLTMLLLFGLAALWQGSSIGSALSILVVGGMFGILVTTFLAFLVVGPIGTGIGLCMMRFTRPGNWQGAANGAITGAILLLLTIALSPDRNRNLDGETLLFAAALVVTGAIAGWMVQRWFLGWPVRPG